ncbi:MAG: XisI protein [Saprospiraceae bacterium]|nr:MAG: XisI protein [Saprospiraceae bacterium]
MDKINRYKEIIRGVFEAYALRKPINLPGVHHQLIMDEKRNHFILIAMGWQGEVQIHDWVFHLEIKGRKILVHEDTTDAAISRILQERGIPEADIVQAYVSEYEREIPHPSSTQ